jgi:hypothetical protein
MREAWLERWARRLAQLMQRRPHCAHDDCLALLAAVLQQRDDGWIEDDDPLLAQQPLELREAQTLGYLDIDGGGWSVESDKWLVVTPKGREALAGRPARPAAVAGAALAAKT